MDLKSILSPSDESARSVASQPSTPAGPASSIPKHVEIAPSGPGVPALRAQHASPLSQSPLSNLPSHVMSPRPGATSSPLISPVPVTPGTPHVQRANSTASMDTLADLASMQTHQPTRPHPFKTASLESITSLDSASRVGVAQPTLTSHPRASIDINMMETPKQTRRVDFTHTSLSSEQKERITELATQLNENPSAYESHIAFINILHHEFIRYVYPTAGDGTILPKQNPATFELLSDLRYARENMDKHFAVGEAIWLDWLQDESMLAHTTDQRVEVIEKFRKAVTEEVASCDLWLAYGDWLLECYRWASVKAEDLANLDEDRMVGKELFTWPMVLDTWQEAIDSTKLDLASSHLVWNKFIEVRISNFQSNKSKDHATQILQLFEQRLKTPHLDSASTKSILANWMHAHFSQDQYFEIMEDTSRIMKDALKDLEDRLNYEQKLADAKSAGDKTLEYQAYSQYLDWEMTPTKRHKVDLDYCNALYQRAELRFPADATLWEDHTAFILEHSRFAADLLSRATRHCPWSGSLWAQLILASDRQGCSYEETEAIKHKATSTGVLEAAGIQEVLKVHAAWCTYLRRRASRPEHDEDDADIAEIGIRASIESLNSLGAKLGLGDAPDPSFRLQRIYINFLSESNRWDNARREFDNAVRDYGNSWQFWTRFYHFEMKRWRRFASKDVDEDPLTSISPPQMATAVLKTALDQSGLDYPEPIIETLLHHCEDYEDADEMQSALLKIRKVEKSLAARREIEAVQAAQAAAVQQSQQTAASDTPQRPQLSKRKRELEDSDSTLHENYKRSRTADDSVETVEQIEPEAPKRDRENASVLVENLSEDATEAKIRQYFSNCGTVRSIKMLENGRSAILEFDEDQAAQYALSRDGQQFLDSFVSVMLDTGSTVFVTNYAPEFGESEVRALMNKFGEIVSIRFPSLQGNKKRRFCYVQFKLPIEAQEAVNNLDGKDIDGLPLTCKISNPNVKKARREGHENDGRTLFVGGLNFKASEDDVKKIFADYGDVDMIRMPRHETMKNRNKGIAFVTFQSEEQAKAALALDGKNIQGRDIKVEPASANEKRSVRQGSSVPPISNGKAHQSSVPPPELLAAREPRSERTIFLTNVPDTVNEARLRQVAAKHGEVVKVILKTNHQGALIEFVKVGSAGEASLALDGFEIVPGRNLRVVSEEEMKLQKPEKKVESFAKKPNPRSAAPIGPSGIVKRPMQPGTKPRKGGNLGQRSVALHGTNLKDQGHEAHTQQNDPAEPVQKSNADFRAMLGGGAGKSE